MTPRVHAIIRYLDHSAPAQFLLDMLWGIYFLHDGGQFFGQLKYYANDQKTKTEAENPVYSHATRLILAYFNVSVRFFSSNCMSCTLTMMTSVAYSPGYTPTLLRIFLISRGVRRMNSPTYSPRRTFPSRCRKPSKGRRG